MTALPKPAELDSAQSICSEPSLSWHCAFCGHLRIYEGGRPFDFGHLDTCTQCGGRVATKPADREAMATIVDEHLI